MSVTIGVCSENDDNKSLWGWPTGALCLFLRRAVNMLLYRRLVTVGEKRVVIILGFLVKVYRRLGRAGKVRSVKKRHICQLVGGLVGAGWCVLRLYFYFCPSLFVCMKFEWSPVGSTFFFCLAGMKASQSATADRLLRKVRLFSRVRFSAIISAAVILSITW